MAIIGLIGGSKEKLGDIFSKMLGTEKTAALHKLKIIDLAANNEIKKINLLLVQEPEKLTRELCGTISQNCYMLINADSSIPRLGAFGHVITYGFNGRASVTASSIKEDSLQVCIQRKFYSLNKRVYEPQEFSTPLVYNCDPHMALGAVAACIVCDLLPQPA